MSGPAAPPGETHPVRRLLPDLAETTIAAQIASLELTGLALDAVPMSC